MREELQLRSSFFVGVFESPPLPPSPPRERGTRQSCLPSFCLSNSGQRNRFATSLSLRQETVAAAAANANIANEHVSAEFHMSGMRPTATDA